jgi:hypothetical protein
MSNIKTPYTWDNANFTFSNNPYTWDDVFFVKQLVDAMGAGEDPRVHLAKDLEKKKKFVKLLCKVEGTEFEESKEIKDINIRIQDVELVINEVLGVNLEVKI